jgi:NADPH-dependent glutamate synthase beta subunit-like oxidoreductase
MLRIGIPEYRLPKDVLDAQIDRLKDMGVEFKTDVTIGRDTTLEKLKEDYHTVFFAVGNQLGRKLHLEGADHADVLWGIDFLRDVNLKKQIKIGKKIVVVGGGNVAIDVALTALRLGAEEVHMACLNPRCNPAHKKRLNRHWLKAWL